MKNKRIPIILGTVALLLLVPAVAMRFTDEVDWSMADLLIAGTLLLSAGLALDLVLRKVGGRRLRIVLCALVLLVLAAIWAELAVGIFDTPFAGS